MRFHRHLIALSVLAACSCQAVPEGTGRAHSHNDLPAARAEVDPDLSGLEEILLTCYPPTGLDLLVVVEWLAEVRTVWAADICLALLQQIAYEDDAVRLSDAGLVGWVLGRITGVPGNTTFDSATLRYDSLEMLRADIAMWEQWLNEHPNKREWPGPASDVEPTVVQLSEILLSPAVTRQELLFAITLLAETRSVAAAEACLAFLRRISRGQRDTRGLIEAGHVGQALSKLTGIRGNMTLDFVDSQGVRTEPPPMYRWAAVLHLGTRYDSLEKLRADLAVWEAWLKDQPTKGQGCGPPLRGRLRL